MNSFSILKLKTANRDKKKSTVAIEQKKTYYILHAF